MKKSVIFTGFGVILLGSWIGTSWYTGKILEKNKEQYIQLANQQLPRIISIIKNDETQSLTNNLQLDLIDFKRGVFSSSARYHLYQESNKQNGIYFNNHIEHGPFPLSELVSFHLTPKLGVIELTLEKNDLTAPLFTVTQQKTPFTLKIIPANKTIRSELEISPVDFNGIKSDKMQFSVLLNEKEKWLTVNSKIDSLSLRNPVTTTYLQGITYNATLQPGQHYYYTGNQTIHVDQLNIQQLPSTKNTTLFDSFFLKNIDFTHQINENNQYLHMQQHANVGQIIINALDFGAMKLDVEFDRINGQVLKQFGTLIKSNPEHAIQALLQSSPEVTLNNLSWRNQGGTGNYSANILFMPSNKPNLFHLPNEERFIAVVKQANSTLSLPLPMFKELAVKSISVTDNISFIDAEERVTAMLPLMALYLNKNDKNKLIIINNEGIKSDMHYAKGQITINGKSMPFKPFWDSFQVPEVLR